MQIGNNIRKLRLFNRHSTNEMAGKLGVSPETYDAYEHGHDEPGMAVLARLLEVFNINNVHSFITDPVYEPGRDEASRFTLFESKYHNLPAMTENILNVILAKTC